MDKHFLKITYHLGGAKKLNAYLKMPSPTYYVVKKEIEMCLFEERKQPRCEIRTFWIDVDGDEIDVINQCDYEIFIAKYNDHQHLQVAPLGLDTEEHAAKSNVSVSNQTKIPPAAGFYDSAVHNQVECDACLMAPIVGFRYKCIQCANYDLCENCESKHVHSEHMMVRMPTNNCPNVVDAYVTGRSSGRRHGKRSKTSYPFVKNGLSIVIDDDETQNTAGGKNAEQASSANGKERHHGRRHHSRHHSNNFFSHLYEMMNDLAEGGGAAAAAHAMGESSSSSKTNTSTDGPQMTTTTTTTTSNAVVPIELATAAAAVAKLASEQAHETAAKAAEIAVKVAHQTAKNDTENMSASASSTTSATASEGGEKEKVDATTSPCDPEPQPHSDPIIPTPSLESFVQFLDPQFVRNGVQILNNFSDMFSKMLDPMETSDTSNNRNYPNLRKNSTTSTKPASSNFNSMEFDKKSDGEKSLEKEQEKITENKLNGSDSSSHVEILDLGSDSENESSTGSFVKIYAPKKGNTTSTPNSSKPTTAVSSVQTTPEQSLNKSDVIDFAQLGADLKAHIAEEATNDAIKIIESLPESVDKANDALTIVTSTTTASDPVVTTATNSTSTTTLNSSTIPIVSEEKRAVPVYHADQRINNSINAMMAMGFSNEGACLTHLLESVNGNIPDALDLMSAAQRDGGR